MKRLQIPQKLLYEKFYLHEKILRTRNCCSKFIKNLLPEKSKENMEAKQLRFKLPLNNLLYPGFGVVYFREINYFKEERFRNLSDRWTPNPVIMIAANNMSAPDSFFGKLNICRACFVFF